MLNSPEPELLRTFVEIVEHGSFTNAAKRVLRTQSAVSMQMRRLERQLGCRLFQRSGRVMVLTTDGVAFYDHAARILKVYREALVAFNGRSVEGEVTVGLPDDYAYSFFPGILARFARAFPWVRVNLVCEPSRKLLSQLADGVLDLALVTEGEGAASGVLVHRERLVWVCSALHRAHEQDPLPLAVFHTGDVFRRFAFGQLEAQGRQARVAVTSLSFAGISAAIDAGLAVGVVFRGNVRPGWRILVERDGFPELPELGLLLQRSSREPSVIVDCLAEEVLNGFKPAAPDHPSSASTAASE